MACSIATGCIVLTKAAPDQACQFPANEAVYQARLHFAARVVAHFISNSNASIDQKFCQVLIDCDKKMRHDSRRE